MQIGYQVLSEPYFVPRFSLEGDGAADLFSCVALTIRPFERIVAGTGIAIEIPPGYGGFILPRSGLALKHGLTLINSPGLVDSGYRGEVKIALVNLSPNDTVEISVGDRVAQLLILPIPSIQFVGQDQLSNSLRSTNGFGSTGRSELSIDLI